MNKPAYDCGNLGRRRGQARYAKTKSKINALVAELVKDTGIQMAYLNEAGYVRLVEGTPDNDIIGDTIVDFKSPQACKEWLIDARVFLNYLQRKGKI